MYVVIVGPKLGLSSYLLYLLLIGTITTAGLRVLSMESPLDSSSGGDTVGDCGGGLWRWSSVAMGLSVLMSVLQ